MKTDIEIAQETKLEHIKNIARKINIDEEDLEYYGKYKAKLSSTLWDKIKNNKDGKLILVTATNPTKFGEGKTTVSIGLADAFNKLNHKAIVALREPSMGPVFGQKGSAGGAGFSQVVPMEDIALHFTGDIHAVTAAHNLLTAMLDNHIHQGNKLQIDLRKIVWKHVLDISDRSLRNIIVSLGGRSNGIVRESGFDIAVASEITAILCLAKNLSDLKNRLSKIIVAYDINNQPITAEDLKATGSLTLLLKDALKPNLVQTLEHNPAIIHGFPFANIAQGVNSIQATKYALKLADYVVTEAGFGSDLGGEKFLNIKCRLNNITPNCVVIVTTLRSLKLHGGLDKNNLNQINIEAIQKGLSNLEKHIENMQNFNVPVVVALNKFNTDTIEEINLIKELCINKNVGFAISEGYLQGGKGVINLANEVIKYIDNKKINFTYNDKDTIEEKIYKIATKIYGANEVNYSKLAKKQLKEFEQYNNLPICMAKTQYSLSDDSSLLGRPENFSITVKELKVNAGAEFIVTLLGDILTMPGLPKVPAAENIDINTETGQIIGLF